MALRERMLDEAVARVRDALAGLAYGSVTVTVHDGLIVQIDRTEKVRLDRAPRSTLRPEAGLRQPVNE